MAVLIELKLIIATTTQPFYRLNIRMSELAIMYQKSPYMYKKKVVPKGVVGEVGGG